MKRPNLYDRLKVLAILTMIVDHIGYTFFPATLDGGPEMLWRRLIGRIAFPIFLFLVGFNLNYKRRWNLLVRAILIQIPIWILSFGFHFGTPALNILFGIILGRVVLGFWQQTPSLKGPSPLSGGTISLSQGVLFIVITIVLLLIHPWLMQIMDYGSFVILFPLMGWMMKSVKGIAVRGSWFRVLLYSVLIFMCLRFFSWYVFGFTVLQLCVLGVFYILLLCIFFVLGQGNRFLPITKKIDISVLFVSKNALLIYIFHLLILGIVKIFLLWR